MQEELKIILKKLEVSDISKMEFPVSSENVRFTKEYIKQYYFQNTIGSCSFWIAIKNNKIEPYKSFKFI